MDLWLFDTSGFPPRWHCGTGWTPLLGWTHILGDLAIFGCYLAIPVVMGICLLRRRDLPFPRLLWLFVAFILTCGLGHLLEAVIFYQPVYRLQAVVKLATVAASAAAVGALVKVMPRVLALPSLEQRNEELERLVAERTAQLATATEEARAAAAAKEDFLRTVSHELRTPLGGLVGAASMFDPGALRARERELLDIIRLSSGTLSRLIGDILDFSRLEAGKLVLARQPLRVAALLGQAAEHVRLQAEAKGLALGIDCDPALWVVGDPDRLLQLVLNLTANAEKFTAQGRIALAAEHDGQLLRIRVEDSGCGMDPATQERIFEAFTQGEASSACRFGGVGLGLSIVDRLLRLMGGRIACHSALGSGTTFTLELPLARHAAAPAAPGSSRVRRALVAEDNPINQQLCRLMLGAAGWEVDLVGDGLQALERCQAGSYDLLLIDIQMPGMDGIEATRAIRDRELRQGARRTPIIAVSANHDGDLRARCLAAGADAFLAKPFDAPGLLEVVGRAAPEAAALG